MAIRTTGGPMSAVRATVSLVGSSVLNIALMVCRLAHAGHTDDADGRRMLLQLFTHSRENGLVLYTTSLLCNSLLVNEATARVLATTFTALADPTRVAIVARLAAGDATVRELTEPFALTQQAISRHLKVLEEAGLVSRRKVAQARPARLEVERLVEAVTWVDARRREWVDRHGRLDQHLRRLTGERH